MFVVVDTLVLVLLSNLVAILLQIRNGHHGTNAKIPTFGGTDAARKNLTPIPTAQR
jgi:hypothetical protein